MILTIELDREEDGRWIAEVVDIPGALAYGADRPQDVGEGGEENLDSGW